MTGGTELYILGCLIIGAINWLKGWKFLPAFLLAFFTTPISGYFFTKIRGVNEFTWRGQIHMKTKYEYYGWGEYKPPIDL